MLTSDQINSARGEIGLPSVPSLQATNPNAPLSGDALATHLQDLSKQYPAPQSYAQRLGGDYVSTAKDISSNFSQAMQPGKSLPQEIGAGIRTGVRTAGDIAGLAFAPIGEALSPALKPLVEKLASLPGVSGSVQRISDWAQKNPEQAKDLGSVLNIAMLGVGSEAEQPLKDAVETGAKNVTESLTPTAEKSIPENALSLHNEALTPKATPNEIRGSIMSSGIPKELKPLALEATKADSFDSFSKAIENNPLAKDLKPEDIKSLYENATGTGKGPITEPTLTGAQKTDITNKSTDALKQRLYEGGEEKGLEPVRLTGKPEDGNTINNAAKKAYSARNLLIDSDASTGKPDLLIPKLQDLKDTIPEGLKDDKTMIKQYNRVIDYAIKHVKNSTNIGDLIEGKSSLADDFEKQFPTIFKKGGIDTKTAGGQAFKAAYDTIKEHIYDPANTPFASQYEALTQRMADLNRATDIVKGRLAGTEGMSKFTSFMKGNPLVGRLQRSLLLRGIFGLARHI